MSSVNFFRCFAIACLPILTSPAWAQDRIVSVGGSVTEIVYALGAADRLVARDSTSGFPLSAQELPSVGYVRNLSPEGVLSVNPDLIIAENDAGPPKAVALLTEAAIPFVVVAEDHTSEGIAQKIIAVGEALGLSDKAATLAAQVKDQTEAAHARALAAATAPKRVLFVLSARDGRVMGAGVNTSADAMIRLSGGVNAVSDVDGYKPLSTESIIAAKPDVILMMDRGGSHSVTDEDLFALPSFRLTPAAKTRNVIRMNGLYLLGFGPRTAQAIDDLSQQLYGG